MCDLFYVPPPQEPTPQTQEPQKVQDWTIREGTVHEAVDRIPSGGDAWTDYTNYDRRLTAKPMDTNSKKVKVLDPLMPGDRVKIKQTSPWSGIYEASRDDGLVGSLCVV